MLLKVISKLPIKAQLKLKILKLYIHSQISFELKIYNFGSTWIDQNLDSICTSHIREWLHLPVNSCIKEVQSLPKKKGGLDIPTLAMLSEKLVLSKRYSMRNSKHSEINRIWNESSLKHVNLDALILENHSKPATMTKLKSQQTTASENHFFALQSQGIIVRMVSECISKSNIVDWSVYIESLSDALFCFARRAFIQQLPTSSNLARWGRTQDPFCTLCNSNTTQTNKHVLSNCSSQIALDRYTIRHNHILRTLADWIIQVKSVDQLVFVDLDFSIYKPISEIFTQSCRPDIVLLDNTNITVLELTVCHETNLQKSKLFKCNKYCNIRDHLHTKFKNYSLSVCTIEISVLGFISDISEFLKITNLPALPRHIMHQLTFQALSSL